MFESAEIDHQVSKQDCKSRIPALRALFSRPEVLHRLCERVEHALAPGKGEGRR